jgi:hypothetical protein
VPTEILFTWKSKIPSHTPKQDTCPEIEITPDKSGGLFNVIVSEVSQLFASL